MSKFFKFLKTCLDLQIEPFTNWHWVGIPARITLVIQGRAYVQFGASSMDPNGRDASTDRDITGNR